MTSLNPPRNSSEFCRHDSSKLADFFVGAFFERLGDIFFQRLVGIPGAGAGGIM